MRYLKATQTAPEQYDAIVTGDLGIVGSELLCDLVMKQGFDITRNHKDCGAMLYDPETQDTHAGGSGCGCSASLLCGHFLPALQAGTMRHHPKQAFTIFNRLAIALLRNIRSFAKES